jgi:Ni2+-binding GTPase involved in maturation of urease and hydrogenase
LRVARKVARDPTIFNHQGTKENGDNRRMSEETELEQMTVQDLQECMLDADLFDLVFVESKGYGVVFPVKVVQIQKIPGQPKRFCIIVD